MKSAVCSIFVVLVSQVAAYLVTSPQTVTKSHSGLASTRLQSVAQDGGRKPVTVTGNNIELTPALKEYTEKKIDKVLEKLGGMVTKVSIHLEVNRNPSVKKSDFAEAIVFAKGTTLRATASEASMYTSIDLVVDTITRELREYKDRNVSAKRHRPSVPETIAAQDAKFEEAQSSASGQETAASDPAAEYIWGDGLPHVDMSVVKTKSFQMTPCTVEDAVMALQYGYNHSFYVFRNIETNEVNFVYKRNSGGVGHVQPERD